MKMRAALANHLSPSEAHANDACPRCGGAIDRITRSDLDRLLSLVVPLRRYRCRSSACAWEGTLRARRDGLSRYGQGSRRRPYL